MRVNPLASVLKPPFKGLWLVALIYFVLSFILCRHSQVLKGNLPDADDYMYLVQVLDWLHGQNWYDNIQHRLNPPDGVIIHFSRLTMLPMAAIILLFEHLGMEIKNSAILMAMIYPVLLFGTFFAVLRWATESFVPKTWTGTTAYIAIFFIEMIDMFMPGHVDHHGLIVMIVAAAVGCALRMMEKPEKLIWGIATGAVLALGMTLALEILPWLLVIAAFLGLWALVKGDVSRQVLGFGISLYLTSLLGLLSFRPPQDFFTVDLLVYSITYVFLTGCILISFIGVATAATFPPLPRLLIGAAFATGAGALFLYRFPELVTGPYGAMNPELSKILLDAVSEARPMIVIEKTFSLNGLLLDFIYHLAGTLLGIGAGLYFLWTAHNEKRWTWGLLLTLLITAFLLTAFYQSRFSGVMEMLTIIPLTAFLQRGCTWIEAHWRGKLNLLAKIGVVLLVAPLPTIFAQYIIEPDSFSNGLLFFPAANVNENPCDMHALAQSLNDPTFLGSRPRLLLNSMDLGPELLFRSPHQFLAAPFLDVAGDRDSYRFFSTTVPEEAKAIATRRHVDLVVFCSFFPAYYVQDDSEHAEEGVPHEFKIHFINIMQQMDSDWLMPLYLPNLENFFVYAVLQPKTKN